MEQNKSKSKKSNIQYFPEQFKDWKHSIREVTTDRFEVNQSKNQNYQELDDDDRMPSLENLEESESPLNNAPNKPFNDFDSTPTPGGDLNLIKQSTTESRLVGEANQQLASGEQSPINHNSNNEKNADNELVQYTSQGSNYIEEKRTFYPKIEDYFPGQKYNKTIHNQSLRDLTQEQYKLKVDKESKQLEKYLNNLFPEKIQIEQELYDPKIIEREMDPNYAKNLIGKKIDNLQKKKWTVPQLLEKIERSYKQQALYLSKISKLYSDHLIMQSNLNEKQKKIEEIQKIVRDLNEYKLSYIDLDKADMIDQLELKHKTRYSKEVNELREQHNDVLKERDFYKQQFLVFKEKYEIIFQEAKEAKLVIQDQIKDLLAYKKEFMVKYTKLQEELKNKTIDEVKKANTPSDTFQTRLHRSKLQQQQQQQQQQNMKSSSLNNTFNNQTNYNSPFTNQDETNGNFSNNPNNNTNSNAQNNLLRSDVSQGNNYIIAPSLLHQFVQQHQRPLPHQQSLANGIAIGSSQQQYVQPFNVGMLPQQQPQQSLQNPVRDQNQQNNGFNQNQQPPQQQQSQFAQQNNSQFLQSYSQTQQMASTASSVGGLQNNNNSYLPMEASPHPVVEPFSVNSHNFQKANQKSFPGGSLGGGVVSAALNNQGQKRNHNHDWPEIIGDQYQETNAINQQQLAQQQSQQQQLPSEYPNPNAGGGVPRLRSQTTAMFGGSANEPSHSQQQPSQQSSLSLIQLANSNNLNSEKRGGKKGQVQFIDSMSTPPISAATKTKQQEEADYYNQLCAKKIKNMVKGISSNHSLLIEESSIQSKRSLSRF